MKIASEPFSSTQLARTEGMEAHRLEALQSLPVRKKVLSTTLVAQALDVDSARLQALEAPATRFSAVMSPPCLRRTSHGLDHPPPYTS
jgi:hypothetical protein